MPHILHPATHPLTLPNPTHPPTHPPPYIPKETDTHQKKLIQPPTHPPTALTPCHCCLIVFFRMMPAACRISLEGVGGWVGGLGMGR